jgi:hypothetical protein
LINAATVTLPDKSSHISVTIHGELPELLMELISTIDDVIEQANLEEGVKLEFKDIEDMYFKYGKELERVENE